MGSVYHFNDAGDTQWRLKVSRAFNAPPLMWIYNSDPVYQVLPNPDLKAERAIVYETGVKTTAGPVGARLDLYRSDVTDGLKLTSVGSDYRYDNVKRIQRQGAEAQLDYQLSVGFKVYISGQYNHVVDRTTDTVIRGNGATTQAFRGGLHYEHPQGIFADISGHLTRWDSRPGKANDHKLILDSKFMKRWDHILKDFDLSVFVNIYNLTNSKYWADPSQPIPARYFEGGVTVNF
jgi:outer membrane receptor protein involved in Fe transport